MLNRRFIAAPAIGLLFALAGCGGQTSPEAASGSPTPSPTTSITLDPSCPATAQTSKPPERVVTMDAAAASILIELGLGDKIVGTAGPDFVQDFEGELRTKLDGIPVIDQRQGNTEAVLKATPDLVTSISSLSFGGFPGTPSLDVLKQNRIAAVAACDAVQDKPIDNIDSSYRYIASLAAAFNVKDEGDKLITRLQKSVQDAAADGDRDVPVLLVSQVPTGGAGIKTSGGASFANGIVSLAGGKNVGAAQNKQFVDLSAEEVTKADPEVIVVVTGFSPKSGDELRSEVVNSPLLASSSAVREKNVVVVPQRIMNSPSLLNAKAIKAIAEAIAAT